MLCVHGNPIFLIVSGGVAHKKPAIASGQSLSVEPSSVNLEIHPKVESIATMKKCIPERTHVGSLFAGKSKVNRLRFF